MGRRNPAQRLKFGYHLCTAIAPAPEVKLTWILFLGKVQTKHLVLGFKIFEKSHSGPEFENGFTKSLKKKPMLRQIYWLLSLNDLNSDPRGPINMNSFPMTSTLPRLGDGHTNCPKSPFLSRVISVQSSHTKWYFRATF